MHIFTRTHPYTYEQMIQDMEDISRLATPFTRLDIIGSTQGGRPIPSLLIGNPHGKKHFLIQGAIHGREYMTTRLIMAQAQILLRLKNQMPNIFSSVCFHLLPMMNPDGVRISQQERLPTALLPVYLKDTCCSAQPSKIYARQWKANGQGIDLNRNFPAGWDELGGPAHPSKADYKGSFPLCAVESRSLASYVQTYPFCSTISYHESGSEIYYKYGTHKDIIHKSRLLAEKISGVSGYPVTTSLSLAAGGFKDWAMEALCLPSVTIEIGQGPAPLDFHEFEEIFNRNQNVPAAMLACASAGQ